MRAPGLVFMVDLTEVLSLEGLYSGVTSGLGYSNVMQDLGLNILIVPTYAAV